MKLLGYAGLIRNIAEKFSRLTRHLTSLPACFRSGQGLPASVRESGCVLLEAGGDATSARADSWAQRANVSGTGLPDGLIARCRVLRPTRTSTAEQPEDDRDGHHGAKKVPVSDADL